MSELITHMSINERYHFSVDRCCYCGDAWKGKRRLFYASGNRVCELCANREREGLVHYVPSNGTEGAMFMDRCERCRHHIDDYDNPNTPSMTPPYGQCKWGVKDKLYLMMWEPRDHAAAWHHPDDLDASTCPATCLRFTPDDYEHDDRDPPPPHDPNQMTFDDVLETRERVPVLEATR